MVAALLVLCLTTNAPTADLRSSFVGFSRNERLAAWHVRVDQEREDGSHDLYALIAVVDAFSGERLQTYRNSSIKRRDAAGKKARASQATLIADNPRFAAAQPRAKWMRLKKKARFHHKRLPMSDSTLRLSPDRDARLTAKATKSDIAVSGATGTPVGYHAIARRSDGHLLSLGHFRHNGGRDLRIDAKVQVFFSSNGYGVAIQNDFIAHSKDGRERHSCQTKVVRFERAPIATIYVGTLPLAVQNLRNANRLYNRLHPGTRTAYEKFVRDAW